MPALSTAIQEFVRQHIHSFEQLETLLLLRNQAQESWTVEAVASKLNISQQAAQEAFAGLQAHQLVRLKSSGSGVRYELATDHPKLLAIVDQFSNAYSENRVEVLKLMSRNAVERVRNSAIRTFADAFLLGRKKDG